MGIAMVPDGASAPSLPRSHVSGHLPAAPRLPSAVATDRRPPTEQHPNTWHYGVEQRGTSPG